MDKKSVRREIVQFFNEISLENLQLKSRKASLLLCEQELWRQSDIILAFLSFGKEFETQFLIESALEAGKKVAVPRIYGKEMKFHYINSFDDNFEINKWNIREPQISTPSWTPSEGDPLMLTPGLAFNYSGGRLGRGGGFYDRFLSCFGKHITTTGLCFTEQIRDDFPINEQDYILKTICSDTRFTSF